MYSVKNSPYLVKIQDIFAKTENRHEVHRLVKPILSEMALDKDFLFEVFRQNLSDTKYLQRLRHYSTLSMSILDNESFNLVMNIFPPLPDKNTEISFQSIHHHGSLLLSTVGICGSGYNSILFKKGFTLNKETEIAHLEIAEDYVNKLGQVDFVDSYQPHVVFYPKDISATYALWSDEKRSTKESLRKFQFLKKIKKPLFTIAKVLGLEKKLGVNRLEYFDFYPKDKSFLALKERKEYTEKGSNENFLQNVFHFIQVNGFKDDVFCREIINREDIPQDAKPFFERLIQGETFQSEFFEGHLEVPYVNLYKKDILRAVN